jgi:hypothetical protein
LNGYSPSSELRQKRFSEMAHPYANPLGLPYPYPYPPQPQAKKPRQKRAPVVVPQHDPSIWDGIVPAAADKPVAKEVKPKPISRPKPIETPVPAEDIEQEEISEVHPSAQHYYAPPPHYASPYGYHPYGPPPAVAKKPRKPRGPAGPDSAIVQINNMKKALMAKDGSLTGAVAHKMASDKYKELKASKA